MLNNTKDKLSLGIELGSTRIKAVLIDCKGKTITNGIYEWENQLADGIWTYSLDEVWVGIQEVIKQIIEQSQNLGVNISNIESLGISAMMHGYLPFDKNGLLLVPFRTWRNVITEEASGVLTESFNFNIPQRWSIAHLYQAILNKETHVREIDFITTLAGYVHWRLTGNKVLGVGDASGMFPISSDGKTYDKEILHKFDELIKPIGLNLDIQHLLPEVLIAGQNAGFLTEEGLKLLDPSGSLPSGICLAPPEGDAGTGMVATNSVKNETGNVSVGTSVFAMVVMDHLLTKVYPEIDMVTTPSGNPVAMVHANNCTSEINAWIELMTEVVEMMGYEVNKKELFEKSFNLALDAADQHNHIVYGYHSGETITGLDYGCPLYMRTPDAQLNVSNFMRAHLDSAFATLHLGMRILKEEGVLIKSMIAHGGIFQTKGVAQKIIAQAMGSSVTVMDTASEGGAWGMAILARYCIDGSGKLLEDYLSEEIFSDVKEITCEPEISEVEAYCRYATHFEKCLSVEKEAINVFVKGSDSHA
ncbi:ATPase [Erysipelothrix larvae]|uniref:ATPase n=1 Tax=Erysipelothrix larvae TaxID=1514105 RepID=A0A109UHN7_9FIRM|nr:FGGY-family carbohydrate kinase [Erysipelothrix larvae]AMC94517.1 ATPase [Erysipelothrix larvae]